jgi:hypothetical protein
LAPAFTKALPSLRCSKKSGTKKLAIAQTVFRSDRLYLALLGANQRGAVEPINARPHQKLRFMGLPLLSGRGERVKHGDAEIFEVRHIAGHHSEFVDLRGGGNHRVLIERV